MSSDPAWPATAAAALTHYALPPAELHRLTHGLINLSLKVRCADGTHYVLQRLHPVFGDGVNANIVAVTAHLRRAGLVTPELVFTRDGARSVVLADGRWRLLTYVEGVAHAALTGPSQAHEAGRQLGVFHRALADFRGELVEERPPVHDLARHLAALAQSRAAASDHPLAATVSALAAELEALRAALTPFRLHPRRLVHGDPKVSNILFSADGMRAVCLIDLDTLAWMPLAYELGDALRSWCNRHGEDAAAARIDLDLFEAALSGYAGATRGFVSAAELAAAVPATLAIHLELAARFLRDVLEDHYFAWDARRYASRAEHNLARARGQLAAATSLVVQQPAASAAVRRIAGVRAGS